MIPIELLSPARDAVHGKAAILHGADAVYIGANRFGARSGASNTVAEIGELVRFAHLYRAKVYAVINTILYDNEIDDAVELIHQLYETGVDALIIQDMGLLAYNLPPIPLFASTQTHNYTPEKITFLEKTGFKRVILARELSLSRIADIKRQTTIALESFVHGALCVSYSGQCYMSHAITGRSGNRGVCAQPCRSAYHLLDADGKTLISQAHLLSLKDLNLSDYLYDMMKAGISSFKIEGRLKDINYLKNITAFYRRKLDAILESDNYWCKASSGKTTFYFEPDPNKTFNRGYTDYFINERQEQVASPRTQKSTGERLGEVTQSNPQYFVVATPQKISNGDGLCWLHPQKGLEGLLVNRVENNKIYSAKSVKIDIGTVIYRNNDFQFEKQLSGHSSDRHIDVSFSLQACSAKTAKPQDYPLSGFILRARDEDGNEVLHFADVAEIVAKDPEKARKQVDIQLRKLGNTAFNAVDITIPSSFAFFIPISELNEMRRQAIQMLEEYRIKTYHPKPVERLYTDARFPSDTLDYRANIANRYAKAFYRQHGVTQTENAFELQNDYRGKVLMTTKYCIKYQFGMCPVSQTSSHKWSEPLFIRDNRHTYQLEFDCKACEMKVRKQENP